MKTLFLEKRGMNFHNDDAISKISDVGNYRVCGRVVDHYGRNLFVEFSRAPKYRRTNKRTGAPLKNPVLEHDYKLHFNCQYDNYNGSWGDINMMNQVWDMDLIYTTTDILKAIEVVTGSNEYDKVIICDMLPEPWPSHPYATKEIEERLYKIAKASPEKMQEAAGYRERAALQDMSTFTYNKEDEVITIYYNGNFASSVEWSVTRQCYVG